MRVHYLCVRVDVFCFRFYVIALPIHWSVCDCIESTSMECPANAHIRCRMFSFSCSLWCVAKNIFRTKEQLPLQLIKLCRKLWKTNEIIGATFRIFDSNGRLFVGIEGDSQRFLYDWKIGQSHQDSAQFCEWTSNTKNN